MMPGSLDDDAYAGRQYRKAEISRDLLLAFSEEELRKDGLDPDELRRKAATLGPEERARPLTPEELAEYRKLLDGKPEP